MQKMVEVLAGAGSSVILKNIEQYPSGRVQVNSSGLVQVEKSCQETCECRRHRYIKEYTPDAAAWFGLRRGVSQNEEKSLKMADF